MRRTRYWTVTRSVASSLSTSTRLDLDQLAEPLLQSPCTRNWVAVASSSLLGAKTSCISPLPKSGRLTRSPGAVNSTCSIRSRMCVVLVGVGRAAAAVEVERVVELHHVPFTRIWVTTHVGGPGDLLGALADGLCCPAARPAARPTRTRTAAHEPLDR